MSNHQLTSNNLADLVEGILIGDKGICITGVSSLEDATEHDISFLANDKYRSRVVISKAGVILVPEDFSPSPPKGRAWIQCKNPSEAFSTVASHYAPPPINPLSSISPSAMIASTATISSSVHIGHNATIGEGVVIGDNSIIEAGSYVGHCVRIGSNCRLFPNVTILDHCVLEDNIIIHSGSVIGSDGFGYINSKEGHKKIPQLGIVYIESNVEIGANVTIDRARFHRTWIKQGVKIDNLVQIAHNVTVGENTIIVSQVGISGSVTIGKNAILAGQVGIPGHVTIGDGAIIMAKSGLLGDAPPGAILMGIPTVPRKEFWKQTAYVRKLPELSQKIKKLENKLKVVQEKLSAIPEQGRSRTGVIDE